MNEPLTSITSLNNYSKLTRESLGLHEAPIISYFGLWLLLARYSNDHRWPTSRANLEKILGNDLPMLQEVAKELVESPHPAVKAAAEAWARMAVAHLQTEVKPMPTQATLDKWASDNTDGYIPQFPTKIDDTIAMLLATAVVGKTEWSKPLQKVDNKLLLRPGLASFSGVITTEAAGDVAVVIPHEQQGLDVMSVIGDPSVTPARLWAAVEEILAKPLVGKPILEDGHSWEVETKTVHLKNPVNPEELHNVFLYPWDVKVIHELASAPGVSDFRGDLPAINCTQTAMGEYTEKGFVGAAVTAMMIRGAMMPTTYEHEVRNVQFDFNRPHALTAITRGHGEWDGLRIFDAWVTPKS